MQMEPGDFDVANVLETVNLILSQFLHVLATVRDLDLAAVRPYMLSEEATTRHDP